ncbi:MAG: hypothetical protein Unbinned5607contig1000_2 [Prokaryotic dsDNA virus sp.]|nr:MAG: hypothetical protein Unbinned5607contig1000_2 [Prokaryotic dsDNA virus sp.]|tara:strand:+ start:28682 stop:28933 length:252 start_codon:yes stop_codon:yes gene_type:complete
MLSFIKIKNMNIKTKDKIVRKVIQKMDDRSIVGQNKYGNTMNKEIEDEIKDLLDFVNDVQEEMMDALLYLESVKTLLIKNKIK